MTGTGGRKSFYVASAALVALALLAGCDRPPAGEAAREDQANAIAAPAAAPAGVEGQGQQAGAPNAMMGTQRKRASSLEREQEKRGPTRQARCRIDDEPERACAFTPVFGDGSFDIEIADRQLRLIISDGEAAPFELIGQRRIPMVGLLQRDPRNPVCWVSDDPDASLKRVCAR